MDPREEALTRPIILDVESLPDGRFRYLAYRAGLKDCGVEADSKEEALEKLDALLPGILDLILKTGGVIPEAPSVRGTMVFKDAPGIARSGNLSVAESKPDGSTNATSSSRAPYQIAA